MKSKPIILNKNETLYVIHDGSICSYWLNKEKAEECLRILQSVNPRAEMVEEMLDQDGLVFSGVKLRINMTTGVRIFDSTMTPDAKHVITSRSPAMAFVDRQPFGIQNQQQVHLIGGIWKIRVGCQRNWEDITISSRDIDVESATQRALVLREQFLTVLANIPSLECSWCDDIDYRSEIDMLSDKTGARHSRWFCSIECYDYYSSAHPNWKNSLGIEEEDCDDDDDYTDDIADEPSSESYGDTIS